MTHKRLECYLEHFAGFVSCWCLRPSVPEGREYDQNYTEFCKAPFQSSIGAKGDTPCSTGSSEVGKMLLLDYVVVFVHLHLRLSEAILSGLDANIVQPAPCQNQILEQSYNFIL